MSGYDSLALYFSKSTVRALAVHGYFFLQGVAGNASVKISKTDSPRVQKVCSSVPSKDDVCDSCPGSLALYCTGAANFQMLTCVLKVISLMPHWGGCVVYVNEHYYSLLVPVH